MYTVSQSTRIVLALLKAHDIRHIIINPGTTNMPIVRGVQNDPFFSCYSIVDERSAIYFAIGLYLQTGKPVVATCTSAQATRNYIPGLTEAFYKHVPVLALTVSKHPKFNYQEYLQAPDQTSLPRDAVKKTFALPVIDSRIDEMHCVRMVNEALLELTHRLPGPVQLNIPQLDSELELFTSHELEQVRQIKRYMQWEEWDISLQDKKVMLVIGEHRPFTEKARKSIEAFCESHNAFIYTNHLSNYHGKYSLNANLAMATMGTALFQSSYKPDVLITIGGQTGDYPLFGILADGSWYDFEHWRVNPAGDIVDTYDKLTKVFECPEETFFEHFADAAPVEDHPYFEAWEALSATKSIPEELPFSNAYLAQQLHGFLPEGSNLNLAILNSLRTWSFFPLDESIECFANVAAFGIDGCMSVCLGRSLASDKLNFMVIGDLAFFYDMNSLGVRHIGNNVRILLINNGIGIEFKNYSHPAARFGEESDPYIAAAGHNGSARGWAEEVGFRYLKAKTKAEFLQSKDIFLQKSDQSILFEVFTTEQDEYNALKLIMESNTKKTATSVARQGVRAILGDRRTEALKKIIKK